MRVKNIFFVCFSFLFLTFSFAQTPGYKWAKRIGGNSNDHGKSVFTDANHNTYVTGNFTSSSIVLGAITLSNLGAEDFFVVKYDSIGNVLWAKSGGGTASDQSNSIYADAFGNVYVTGVFQSTSMVIGSSTLSTSGAQDIFIVKYNSSGSVAWAKKEGGTTGDHGRSICSDNAGNVLLTGYFTSPTLTSGSVTLTNVVAGSADIVIIKYDSLGNTLWANNYAGTGSDIAEDIGINASGEIFIAGYFQSSSLSFGAFTITNSAASPEIFIAKFTSAGTPMWANGAGGTTTDIGRGLAVDQFGNVILAGYFSSATASFGSITLTKPGVTSVPDGFVAKYDSLGNVLWAKSVGGAGVDQMTDVSVDIAGMIYVSGMYYSSSIVFGSTTLNNPGATSIGNIFVLKYDNAGNELWAKSAVGGGDDRSWSVSSFSDGLITTTGYYMGANIVMDGFTLTNPIISGSSQDGFVAALCDVVQPIVTTSGPTAFCSGDSVILTASAGYSSYLWSNGLTTQSITVTTSGTYSVTGYLSSGCSALSTTTTISVTPSSIAVPTSASYCNGSMVSGLNFTATPSGGTISWTNTDSSIGIPSSGTGSIAPFTVINTGSSPIMATITVTSSVSGCSFTPVSFTITVNPSNDASFSYLSSTYCQLDANPTPSVTVMAGGYFYSSLGLVFMNSTTGEIDLSASAGNNYIITHVSGATCPDSVSQNILINSTADVNAGSDATICTGDHYTLPGIISGSASSLLWTTLGSGTFDNDTLLYASYYPSLADITAGAVSLIAETDVSSVGCGGSGKDTVTITIDTCTSTGMVGSDAYIKGKHVEIGLNGLGGFEGVDTIVSPLLAGMHHRSHAGGQNFFGFVANPQLDNWATFDGDFYTPGYPENGWGFEIDTSGGIKAGNNCGYLQEINGAITSWSYVTPYYSSDWEGDYLTGTNLHFKINTTLHEDALFYTTTVSITNNTSSTISELYYYKNIDPDNNVSLYYSTLGPPAYMTINTIVRQGGTGDTAQVTAVQNVPRHSYFSLAGLDTNWRACYGGFTNRDASNLWYGTAAMGSTFYTALGSSDSMDAAISLTRKIQNFLPSTTRTFRFCTIFTDSASDCAIASLSTSLPPLGIVCSSSAQFELTGGTPAGGTYSGPGVVNDTMFDPGVSGIGTFNIAYTVDDSSGCQKYATSSIQVDLCTGVSKPSKTSSISMSVYPNPNNGNFNVMFTSQEKSNYKLELRNVLGQAVYQETLPDFIGTYSKPISVSNFGKGVYTITLTNDKHDVVKKIIVY